MKSQKSGRVVVPLPKKEEPVWGWAGGHLLGRNQICFIGLSGELCKGSINIFTPLCSLNGPWEAATHNLNPLHMPPWKQSLIRRVHGLSYYGKSTLF